MTIILDLEKHFLGKLCKYNHDWENSGFSLRTINGKQCAICKSEYLREYQRKNADEIREYRRLYRQENADKVSEYQRNYRQENADKKRERDQIYN